MSAALALSGWIAAGVAGAVVVAVQRAVGTRREAVARASHELRGPLTAARLGLAVGFASGELSPGRLRAIDAELGRAALALDDLTDPDGGPGRLRDLGRFDARAVATDSVEAWQGAASAAGAALALEWDGGGAVVWGDRLRLAQAIGNLIANAIEHGEGMVRVRGTVRRQAGGSLAATAPISATVRIVISDDGPGLPAAVPDLCHRPRRGRGHRGRGLAIAAEVARAHGGRLAGAPSPRGARLVLELPATAAAGLPVEP
jgi:signal transduction histidine kinase